MRLQRAAGALGAYVSDLDIARLVQSSAAQAELRGALVEHEVLFFREQPISAQTFTQFAQCFGSVLPHPAYDSVADAPEVQILESTAAAPSKIELWHSDMTFAATPPHFTFLQGKVIPQVGGDTLWASATAAFAGLSTTMQDFLLPLRAVHDFKFGFQESLAEPGGTERLAASIAANPAVTHPLIRTHPETGKRAIYVNALFTREIEGLTLIESRQLLDFLCRQIVTEEFTVRLQWQPDTLVVWDNRSTQHKPVNDYFPAHRLLHRITLEGDRPV